MNNLEVGPVVYPGADSSPGPGRARETQKDSVSARGCLCRGTMLTQVAKVQWWNVPVHPARSPELGGTKHRSHGMAGPSSHLPAPLGRRALRTVGLACAPGPSVVPGSRLPRGALLGRWTWSLRFQVWGPVQPCHALPSHTHAGRALSCTLVRREDSASSASGGPARSPAGP